MRPYLYGPNRGEGYRLGAFKCENEGVYNEVNDRSPNHEERAQDAPLSLRTKPRRRVADCELLNVRTREFTMT